jgi:hypothetical protein
VWHVQCSGNGGITFGGRGMRWARMMRKNDEYTENE